MADERGEEEQAPEQAGENAHADAEAAARAARYLAAIQQLCTIASSCACCSVFAVDAS